MHSEILALTGAVVLGVTHILLQSTTATLQLGSAFNLSPRDETRTVTGSAARLERASKNFQETFPLFAAAVLLVLATDSANQLTGCAALTYLGARVIYLPLYVAGIKGARTLAWMVATGSILAVLFGACCAGCAGCAG